MKPSELLEFPAIAFQLDLESFGPSAIQLPTFQDVGNAVFSRPDGVQSGILDTHASMANRLEAAVWNDEQETVINCLEQMPFVSVRSPSNQLVTASLLESHRLNSPYIFKSTMPGENKKFEKYFGERLKAAEGTPGGYKPELAKIFAGIDPCSLIHGTFMSYSKEFELSGAGSKLTAALTGFAEVANISPVEYGTAKQDRIDARQGALGKSNEGFGTFQTPATLWYAEQIAAYYYLDIDLLHSYQLGNTFVEWTVCVSLLKILRFIRRGLRLRSHCILQPQLTELGEIALNFQLPLEKRNQNYFEQGLPDQNELENHIVELTQTLRNEGIFGEPLVLEDAVTGRE